MTLPAALVSIFKNRQASYKMVLILSVLDEMDSSGMASLERVVDRFLSFYQQRADQGLVIERPNAEMNRWESLTSSRISSLILENPFKALNSVLELDDDHIGFNSDIWDQMKDAEISELRDYTLQSLDEYYQSIELRTNVSLRDYLFEIMTTYHTAKSQQLAGHSLGELVRRTVPEELRKLPFINGNYKVQGSVGQGNWARIPWIAIMDKRITDTTQRGEYIVYLFSEDMKSVYLTLAQGVTVPINERGRKGGYDYLRNKTSEIRDLLTLDTFRKDDQIYLTQGGLGQDYQVSTIAYIRYDIDQLPSDEQLISDLRNLCDNYQTYVEKAVNKVPPVIELNFNYSIAYLHYIQGIMRYLGEQWPVNISVDELINKQALVLKSGDDVKFPKERVQHLGRAMRDLGLIDIQEKYFSLTSLGKDISDRFGEETWKLHDPQVGLLRKHITSFQEPSILLQVIRIAVAISKELNNFSFDDFKERFVTALNKNQTWTPVTQNDKSKFMLNWITELQYVTKMGDRYMYVEQEETNEIAVRDSVQHIKEYIRKKGFTYPENLIENFYLSIKTKPFVILAGISGTGKTKLVKLFAEAVGANEKNGQFVLIPVRPDWNDPSDLLGYTDLSGKFRPGRLTEVLYEAAKDENQHKPFFICLDEMNLARVEHYFSDLLSIMETQKRDGARIVTDRVLSTGMLDGEDKDKYGNLYIPQNVIIIGTVNMDETTHPFSKKVLDRANTLEFNFIDLNVLPDVEEVQGTGLEPLTLNQSHLSTEYLTLKEAFTEYNDLVQRTTQKLIEVNQILENIHAHIGFRVRDNVCFYLIYNTRFELMEENDAFDLQLLQKILPRIQGSSSAVKRTLLQIYMFATNQRKNLEELMSDASALYESKPAETYPYPLSARKIAFMLRRYEEDGFTSFWLS